MYYMALYLKHFRKSKIHLNGLFFLVCPHKCVLSLFEKNQKDWKEMTKMCQKASVALMGFEPINIQVTVRFLTIQNEVTT